MLKVVTQASEPLCRSPEDVERERRFQLAKLLRCTEDILVAAKQGEWEFVEAQERARRDELFAVFEGIAAEESPVVAEALASLIFMNEQIMTLVVEAKQQTLRAGQAQAASQIAVKNYQLYQDNLESI